MLEGCNGEVMSLAFSPNDQQIVSGSNDETVMIWDVTSGKAIDEPLVGHSDWVMAVTFARDGMDFFTRRS